MSMSRLQSISGSSSIGRSAFPPMKDYILTEKLGTGTFATVYKAHKKVII